MESKHVSVQKRTHQWTTHAQAMHRMFVERSTLQLFQRRAQPVYQEALLILKAGNKREIKSPGRSWKLGRDKERCNSLCGIKQGKQNSCFFHLLVHGIMFKSCFCSSNWCSSKFKASDDQIDLGPPSDPKPWAVHLLFQESVHLERSRKTCLGPMVVGHHCETGQLTTGENEQTTGEVNLAPGRFPMSYGCLCLWTRRTA